MEIRYKRSHNESYMIIEHDCDVNEFEERMIRQNNVKSLLTYFTIKVNDRVQFWYNITGKQSLKEYLETSEQTIENLEKILFYFQKACDEINLYLIAGEHILINPDTIFFEKKDGNFAIYLCYMSEDMDGLTTQFRTVLEHFISIVNHSDEVLERMVYELYDIAGKDGYSIMELLDYVNEKYCDVTLPVVEKVEIPRVKEDYEPEQTTNVKPNIKVDVKMDTKTDTTEFDSYFEEYDFYQEPKEKKGILEKLSEFFNTRSKDPFEERKGARREKKNFDKDKLYENESHMDFEFDPEDEVTKPTVLLSANSRERFCIGKLLYDGNGFEDNYMIDTDNFRVGTSTNSNHACLKSKTVSRNHARIMRQGEQYYLEDLNSTNGTYLNGKSLEYRQPVRLNPMDKIRFADVEYIFM